METQPIQFLLIVTEKAGWVLLDTPRSRSEGALQRGAALPVGKSVYAYDILSIDGVPYASILPDDPSKPLFGRVGEFGSVVFDQDGNFVSQKGDVKSYVKVIRLRGGSKDPLAAAINNLADAIRSSKNE
jgi:hypothetical protein